MENLCFTIYRFLNYIILPIGIILNLICIVIFKKIIKNEPPNQKNNLFKYLFIKSICDFIYPTIMLGDYIYHKSDSSKDTTLIMQLWYIVMRVYFVKILTTLSIYFEILATLDCFLMISRALNPLKTFLCFKISTIIMVTTCCIFYIPLIVGLKLNSFTVINLNSSYHKIYNITKLKDNTDVYNNLIGIFRDLIPNVIIFGLNVFILITLRRVTKQKKKNNLETVSIRKALKAERNKVKMIFFTSLIYLFHLPSAYRFFEIFDDESCFNLMTNISYRFSFSIAFFSYFLFNSNFRKYLTKRVYS
jgi:hypothetical protein